MISKISGVISFLFLILIATASFSEETMMTVNIDKVSFDDNGMLKVYDESNKPILQFNRFENKNIQGTNIKNTRIFDMKNKPIMTVVIFFDQSTIQLHLQNKNNAKGLINIATTAGFGSIKTDITIDYFGKKYSLTHNTAMGMGSIETEKVLSFNEKPVMNFKAKTGASGSNNTGIQVDRDFLSKNKEDAAIWSILFLMMTELGK
jgi:hypothetical protein